MRRPFMTTRERLSGHTSFRIGGPAEFFFRPETQEELARVARFCRACALPVRVIGMGTNLIVNDDGVAGAVIATSCMNQISVSGDTIIAECGAGLPKILSRAAAGGLSGLEPLAGIPGSLGGAIRMNAGTRDACIADVIEEVTVLKPDGRIDRRPASSLKFGYRRSDLAEDIVLSARLKFAESKRDLVGQRTKYHLSRKHDAQPLGSPSAGCVFKNPEGEPAGALLDRLGLKGSSVGCAGISNKHANFIVNNGGATAADVFALINSARRSVQDEAGIQLELEVEIW